MSISWNDKYNFGFPLIDGQHQLFINTLSDLYLAVNDPGLNIAIRPILAKLDCYIDIHFSTEEKFFKKYSYPGTQSHIEAHQQFKDKIEQIKQSYSSNESKLAAKLIDFMESWFADHLTGMDRSYVDWFRNHGL